MSKLAEFLKQKRADAGLSQMKVAATLGYTTPQFISNWERGVSQPPPNAIKQLAKIYGVSTEELLNIVVEETADRSRANLKARFNECEA